MSKYIVKLDIKDKWSFFSLNFSVNDFHFTDNNICLYDAFFHELARCLPYFTTLSHQRVYFLTMDAGDDTHEDVVLSLAEAFKRRRGDFISGTNQRHQEARGKVKKKLSGHGALSKTLASWKKSHTGKQAQSSGKFIDFDISMVCSMQ